MAAQPRPEFRRRLAMPAEYFSDNVRRKLCALMEEDSLKDICIELRGSSVNFNSSILSLLSPVLRTAVCGDFKESICRKISLDDVSEERLIKLLRIGCGEEVIVAEDFEESIGLGELAERLEMEAVRSEIEDKILSLLKVDDCLEMMQRIEASGLAHLQQGCYHMMRDNFEVLSQESDIFKLSEATMVKLLEDDGLEAGREEVMFEALLLWTRGGEGMRGMGLLRKIRYGVMRNEYLRGHLSSAVLCEHEEMQQVIKEALTKKGVVTGNSENEIVWDGVKRLCDKWMVARRGMKGWIIGADMLKKPKHVAIDVQGKIIVSDWDMDEILIFNFDGSIARRFGSKGSAAGQFKQPTGVAVDRQGHIVVVDQGNNRIQVLNEDGSVVRCFGSEGEALGQLNEPQGVAIDMEGHIVVADCCNHRIQVFNMEGSVVRHLGTRGSAVGQLDCPCGVAVDAIGRIVVADCLNHRVQVFNIDGSVALCFSSCGDGPFRLLCGVAVDREGRFVVTDTMNHRMQVFNPDGSVARIIGYSGQGVGQLRHPYGVAVNKAGRIFVVEGYSEGFIDEDSVGNHRVQVF